MILNCQFILINDGFLLLSINSCLKWPKFIALEGIASIYQNEPVSLSKYIITAINFFSLKDHYFRALFGRRIMTLFTHLNAFRIVKVFNRWVASVFVFSLCPQLVDITTLFSKICKSALKTN